MNVTREQTIADIINNDRARLARNMGAQQQWLRAQPIEWLQTCAREEGGRAILAINGYASSETAMYFAREAARYAAAYLDAIALRDDAIERAREASKNGYVQHVNRWHSGYIVSDWYSDDATIASFENGREL